MIEKTDVDAALATAMHALETNAGLAWIKKSSLLVQAYYCGLAEGMGGLAKEEDIRPILLNAVAATLVPRSADDRFATTRLGKEFERLTESLMKPEAEQPGISVVAGSLKKQVDRLDRGWSYRLGHTRHLVEQLGALALEGCLGASSKQDASTQHDRRRSQTQGILEVLEQCVRQISLLEEESP